MTKAVSKDSEKRRPGKDGLFFLLAMLGALLLELPGYWCLLGAAVAASCFLLFLRHARGGGRPAPASRIPRRDFRPAPPYRQVETARLAAPGGF
jgi:hypothetical protein